MYIGILTISHAHVWYRKSLCKIICPDKRKSKKERKKEKERKKGKKENSEVWVIKLKVITEEVIHSSTFGAKISCSGVFAYIFTTEYSLEYLRTTQNIRRWHVT